VQKAKGEIEWFARSDNETALMKCFSRRIVSGLVIKDHQVLLGLRKNTKDFANYWSVPVGHVEKNESEQQALKREMEEEIGIEITSIEKLRVKTDDNQLITNSFYWIKEWHGKIDNKEPDLCEPLEWFSIDNLPTPLTPICKQVFDELDWSKLKL